MRRDRASWERRGRLSRGRSPCGSSVKDQAKTKRPPRLGTMGGRCRSTSKGRGSDGPLLKAEDSRTGLTCPALAAPRPGSGLTRGGGDRCVVLHLEFNDEEELIFSPLWSGDQDWTVIPENDVGLYNDAFFPPELELKAESIFDRPFAVDLHVEFFGGNHIRCEFSKHGLGVLAHEQEVLVAESLLQTFPKIFGQWKLTIDWGVGTPDQGSPDEAIFQGERGFGLLLGFESARRQGGGGADSKNPKPKRGANPQKRPLHRAWEEAN